jgi:hypothetical protein
MLTTADAPAHDEERERDRLSLQNHVISFSNETLDEVKETILETPKWKFQRGDDAGGMQPLCNTVHFSLSPLYTPKRKSLGRFLFARFSTSLGYSSFVHTTSGGQKITVTTTIDLFPCFVWVIFFFFPLFFKEKKQGFQDAIVTIITTTSFY